MKIDILKTDSGNKDFQNLVNDLDFYLAEIDGSEHSFYAQFNKIDKLTNCIIIYINKEAVSCGAFKEYDHETVEIKRMYTKDSFRGRGFAKMVLRFLEKWAKEDGYKKAVLETGERQVSAVELYKNSGYKITPNYGQYEGIENSICFLKEL
jgi:GNAT superfamily N-acetyltransferase